MICHSTINQHTNTVASIRIEYDCIYIMRVPHLYYTLFEYLMVYQCIYIIPDLCLKEDANKKAFEHFAKESHGGATVEVAEVSERYESKYCCTFHYYYYCYYYYS